MADLDKKAQRDRKARAYKDLVRDLASVSRSVYKPTASSIFDCLSQAHLNEQSAESARLSRETLFGENPGASVPEELSDEAISQYLASAGDFYAGAAADYLRISDLPRAYKYFRKAARHGGRAAALAAEDGPKLLQKSQAYQDQAAVVRQELARRSLLRIKWSLGFLTRSR